jgi:hypothetical protein
LLAGLLLGVQLRASGQEAGRPVFTITGVDLTNLPLVNVTVSGSNLGAPLADLPAVLKEDKVEQPILESKPQEVGIATAFLIDASNNIRDPGNTGEARIAEIATAVEKFIQMKVLAAETDWMAAYTIAPTGDGFQQLSDWTQDHQSVANELRLYQPQEMPETTPLFNLIKYGLDQIEIGPFADNLRRTLVVFSDGFDNLSAVQIDDIVNRANRLGVTIHTVMIGPEAENRRQNLQRIADVTDGEYVLYAELADMEQLWSQVAAERRQQVYTYRLTKAQPELLEMAVTAPNQRTFGDEYNFPFVPAQPAEISIAQPAIDAVVQRTGAASDTAEADLDPTTLPISLDVQWPDGHPRNFARIEYEVGGDTRVVTAEPFTTFAFPLSGLDEGAQTLRVLAIDELGIESKSAPQSFRIEFVLPPPAAAEVPPAAAAAEDSAAAGAAAAADTADPAAAAGDPGAEGSDSSTTETAPAGAALAASETTDTGTPTTVVVLPPSDWTPGLSWQLGSLLVEYGTTTNNERQLRVGSTVIPVTPATIALAAAPFVLLIALLAVAGMRRSKSTPVPQLSAYEPATSVDNKSTMIEATAYELTEDATEAQPIVDFESPASLVYVEGGEHLPKKLNIEGGREIRIGRKAAYCDVLIDDQRVSRLHASIHEREDGNFYLKDEGSSGGTFVNRRKLRVNDSHLLRHGDVINFNTVAYTFELADGGAPHTGSPTGAFTGSAPGVQPSGNGTAGTPGVSSSINNPK